jgi:hypothetical protein
MARSTCKKCGALISDEFSSFGTWYYLDHKSRAWNCYNGEAHEPRGGETEKQAVPSPVRYERMVNDGDAELHYRYGVHEFGPGFVPKYVEATTGTPIGDETILHKTRRSVVWATLWVGFIALGGCLGWGMGAGVVWLLNASHLGFDWPSGAKTGAILGIVLFGVSAWRQFRNPQ